MFALLSSSLTTCVAAVLWTTRAIFFNKKRKINVDLLFKRLYQLYSNNMTNFAIISFLNFYFIFRQTGDWRHVRATEQPTYTELMENKDSAFVDFWPSEPLHPCGVEIFLSHSIGAKFRISNDLKRPKGYGGLMVTTRYILRFHLYSFLLKFIRFNPSAITKRM